MVATVETEILPQQMKGVAALAVAAAVRETS
jgi:hypothetical protein